MEKRTNRSRVSFWILMTMLLTYLGMILVINLCAPPSFYDSDMYSDMCYAVQMWNHKSVFPEGWVFGNQLYAVSTPVLAGLCYGLIGNPVLAMGLASTIMAVLVLLSFDWMLRPVVEGREGRLAGMVLLVWMVLFFGDSWHSTNGWQLLFTMCSYYAVYAVCAFLAFGCYLRSQELQTRKLRGMMILTCLLSFGLGIQSLRQTAVMTLPLLGVECLHILQNVIQKRKWDRKTLTVAALIAGANLAGLMTARCLKAEQVEITGDLGLTAFADFFGNLRQSVLLALSLVFNHDGVSVLILGMLLLLCGASVIGIVLQTQKTKDSKGLALFILLLFSVLAVLAVDVLTTMLVRAIYYFMLFPMLAFLAGRGFAGEKDWKRWGLLVLLSGVFLLSLVRELPDVVLPIRDKKEESAYAVSEYLMENGYTTVYSAWNGAADVPVASDWKISAGFWEDAEDPFFYYQYLCNPEIFHADKDRCVYLFHGQQYAEKAMEKAATKDISVELVQTFPQWDIYLYTASENIMEAFG